MSTCLSLSESPYFKLVSNMVLHEINKILYYYMWTAACITFPGLNNFLFVNALQAASLKWKGIDLVRIMVSKLNSKDTNTMPRTHAINNKGNSASRNVPSQLGKESFKLSESLYFFGSHKDTCTDDIDKFLQEKSLADECAALKSDTRYVVTPLFSRLISHFYLSRVTLQILATPTSLAMSEKDFSIWKLLAGSQRSQIDDETVENNYITNSNKIGEYEPK